ncbi:MULTISPECIES: hypothetical protein [unclassified Methylophilus]|jgi:hypothetical protein|uniref:hypothetical protein n=1 Tax=unclassified Methylophilus TaxID=2630143 RepID=UPI0006FABA41|nr:MULTISPECIES: hypothetical protein [unclassified Methylophilus]KQT41369.1 hypothetical protein ASG34_11550 [Methylophilus sp. Leaf416]KQT57890.1 hypothetical protein ASG44_13150 [Methylophilus sp. Leaf459]
MPDKNDKSNNHAHPPETPVLDETSLLPPKTHKKNDKQPPGSHSAEIAAEVEEGQLSPGELSSENDI